MRTRLGLLALLSATVLAGCPADSNKNNNGTGKDMTVVRDLTGGGEEDDGGTEEDLRRRRDLTDTTTDDGGTDEDLTTTPTDEDMTVVGGDTDMTGAPGDDLTGVAPGPDMTTTGTTPDLFSADLLNQDMAPTTCSTTPTLDVKSMTVSNLAWSATGSDTFQFPSGFLVSGTLTLTDGETLAGSFNSIRVRLINRFTGQTYETSTGTNIPDVTNNLVYAYSLVVPAGEYYVASRFAFVFEDGSEDAQLVAYRTEPSTVAVCPALPATPTAVNVTHEAIPTLSLRTVKVSGLRTAYASKSIDPAPATNRLFIGGLYLESTDGRLVFFKPDSGYVPTAVPADEQDAFQFINWPLPKSNTGFVVQPTFTGDRLSTNDNGWSHSFRFDATKTITFSNTVGAEAFTPLTIGPSQIVTISGTPSDPNGRLFKPWDAFTDQFAYIQHAANCPQVVPSDDLFTRPVNNGDFFTDNPPYSFPVKKGASCDFFGGFRIRLPLASNQGGTLAVPANIANSSANDIFILISPTETLSASGNTTQNLTVPNLSGDVKRTVTIQNAAGVVQENILIQAEGSLTDFPTYAGRSDYTVTNASGQVELNLLKGTYFITVDAL